MLIGVPLETAAGETRVAVTPETAKKLKARGHTVRVQSGAGVAASAPDAGAEHGRAVEPSQHRRLQGGHDGRRQVPAPVPDADDRRRRCGECSKHLRS
jgi:hypothetical protein